MNGGINVVVFHESARVAEAAFSDGTEVTARTGFNSEDGWEVDYSVDEIVLPPQPPQAQDKDEGALETFLRSSAPADPDVDDRLETLRLDAASFGDVDDALDQGAACPAVRGLPGLFVPGGWLR